MLISKQELCESLCRMTPRTFAYINELDYPDFLLQLEQHGIKLPTANQLQKAIQFPQYPPTIQHDSNHFIRFREETPNAIEDEKLRFLHFYSTNHQSEILKAYSRMTKLKIKETVQPLKFSFPLDTVTLTNELDLPPIQENRDTAFFLYALQKLLSESKKCNLKFSIQNNIVEMIYPNHIVKIFFNLYKSNKSIYPLQIFISAHCRVAPFIEQIGVIIYSYIKSLIFKYDRTFLTYT